MRAIFAGLIMLGWLSVASAATITWTNSTGTNNWYDAGNWDAGIPANGDDVVITNANIGVTLTNSSANLNSLVLSNATLIFSNWYTVLTAATVNIQADGMMTLPPAYTNNVMSNRVYIVCSNLSIDAEGKIDVDNKGYSSTKFNNYDGCGPGGGLGYAYVPPGASGGGGGSHGGVGGYFYNNLTYGSAVAPEYAGSGGGQLFQVAGYGGGAVRIQATGTVRVDGLISANGGDAVQGGSGGGGGSGGSIYITCDVFAGTNTSASNGVVRADGGKGSSTNHAAGAGGGGGGGGRIAVVYQAAQSSAPTSSVIFSVAGGIGSMKGDIGTLYFPDTLFLTGPLQHNGQIYGLTNWSPDSLTISNGWIRFPAECLRLTVSNNVTVMGSSGRLEIGGSQVYESFRTNRYFFNMVTGPVLTCGGNLTLTDGGALAVYVGPTNAAMPYYGALVDVTGDVFVANGSWIYPYLNPTNGYSTNLSSWGPVLFRMRNLIIGTNSGFNADRQGYGGGWDSANNLATNGYGPGGGHKYGIGNPSLNGGGACYGGLGGLALTNETYGSVSAPMDMGSGGGGKDTVGKKGGNGGGVILIQASGAVTNNGLISANGEDSRPGEYTGGGSGGSVYIRCATFSGTYSGSSNGVINASGGGTGTGGNDGGGGGGGRIAIVYTNVGTQAGLQTPTIQYLAAGGSGIMTGDIGTVYFSGNLLLTETLPHTGQLLGFTNWSPNNLIITNGFVRFIDENLLLNVTNDVLVSGSSSRLELGGNTVLYGNPWYRWRYYFNEAGGPTLNCGGNLTLTNSASMYVYVGWTNAAMPEYGALVNVTGDLYLETNTWIYPCSMPTNNNFTNGNSVLFVMNNLTIQTNAGFNANGKGYAGGITNSQFGFGPGGGSGIEPSAGGSHGGTGGLSSAVNTYGDSNAPVIPGSGGGAYGENGGTPNRRIGGDGGGAVRIRANGTLTLNGIITAGGTNASPAGQYSAGGSGGGVYIYCRTFAGTNGFILANGGPAKDGGGGGGGGRIAVWRAYDLSDGVSNNVSAAGGSGVSQPDGAAGSIVWMFYIPPRRGTFFWIN